MAPAEKTGALTGRQYEYQHEQATVGALEMLAQPDRLCVYCEWHDDFVVESTKNKPVGYHFHQVKSKSLALGAWTFHDIFGVSPPKPKTPAQLAKEQAKADKQAKQAAANQPAVAVNPHKALVVGEDAIFRRLLAHYATFEARCAEFVFVTNNGVAPDVTKLVEAVASVSSFAALESPTRSLFDQLVRGYVEASPPLVATASDLFSRLKSLRIATEQGSLKPESALNDICNRVFEYSEIDLQMSDQKQIARQLVQLVRTKATDTSVKPPAGDAVLRARKGVVISELLGVLSLSHEGYTALRDGGSKDLVKTLSRLQRYCRKAGGLEPYTAQICSLKAKWDTWRTTQRHQIQDADYLTIVNAAHAIISAQKTLDVLINLARQTAEALQASLPSGVSIEADHVLGLVFSLAADAEPA